MIVEQPEDMNRRYDEAFNSGNIDVILALYEPEAKLIIESGTVAVGTSAIREVYRRWLILNGVMKSETQYCIQLEDIALLRSKWHLTGTDSAGNSIEIQGDASEVIRRQPDGRWCYIIAHGSGAA